jgi:hypothetical protein
MGDDGFTWVLLLGLRGGQGGVVESKRQEQVKGDKRRVPRGHEIRCRL